jgi:hypothetical protein
VFGVARTGPVASLVRDRGFATLLGGMKARLALATRPRAGRVANAGIKMVRTDDGLQFGHPVWTEPESEERRMLLHCAKAAVKGDKGAMEVMWSYTCAVVEHLRSDPIRIGSSPSPATCGLRGRAPLLPPARRLRGVKTGDRPASPGAPAGFPCPDFIWKGCVHRIPQSPKVGWSNGDAIPTDLQALREL